jgi:hypothetical protein
LLLANHTRNKQTDAAPGDGGGGGGGSRYTGCPATYYGSDVTPLLRTTL